MIKEKDKEYYKRICLQLEYQLYKKEQEIERLNNKINKTINILELSAQNKGICTCNETDTIQIALKELKEKSDNNDRC